MGKILRLIAIVFMGLTAIFTLLGGAGTTCVALAAERWPSMASIVPFKWLYVIFVVVTVAVGVMMIRAFWLLVRGRVNAYRDSLVSLFLGVVVGVIHIAVSRSLRGSSMPVDAVTYSAVLTLVIFLLLRIPGVWELARFDKMSRPSDSTGPAAAAITLLLSGLVVLTVQYWARPAHTFDSANWADAWHASLGLLGWGLVTAGAAGFVWIFHRRWRAGETPAVILSEG